MQLIIVAMPVFIGAFAKNDLIPLFVPRRIVQFVGGVKMLDAG
jgi:hypothetical protein